jgi:superfamily II DNA or RNA helicase
MKVELHGQIQLFDDLYPHLDDPLFNERITQRSEFHETKIPPTTLPTSPVDVANRANELCDAGFELAPHQKFVRQFLSSRTPYNGLLLYHGLGTGKTCSAITIAEEFRTSYSNARIYVVGNEAIQDNFKTQMFHENLLQSTPNGWDAPGCSKLLLRDLNLLDTADKRTVIKKAKDLIAAHYHFVGYEKLSNEIKAIARSVPSKDVARHLQSAYHNTLFIIDEVHNFLRESIHDFMQVLTATQVKLLLLSATPMYGDLTDIVTILNMLKLNDKLPAITVDDIFKGDELKDGGQPLADHVRGYVSFVKGENPYSFPYRIYPNMFTKKSFSVPSTPMNDSPSLVPKVDHINIYPVLCSDIQERAYAKAVTADIIQDMSVPFRLNALMCLNMSYPGDMYGTTGLEHAMKETKGVYTYKSERCFDPNELKKYSSKLSTVMTYVKGEGIILVYTQFIKGGAVPLALALEAAGFRRFQREKLLNEPVESNGFHYALLSGNAVLSPNNDVEIDALRHPNNKDGSRIKVVIVTRAAAEGVDFKNVRQVHILDPWWHMERIEQIIGRGVRFCSHKDLPFEQRNCMIFLYASLLSDDSEALDMYMYRCSETKAIRVGKVTRLLKQHAVDCILNSSQNGQTLEKLRLSVPQILSTGKQIHLPIGDAPYTAQCDYLDTCLGEDARDFPIVETGVPLSDVSEQVKRLFRTFKVLEKSDLFARIHAPEEAVYAALIHLIRQKEHIIDHSGLHGYVINVGELYMFQPINLPESISMYERRVPPTPVPYSISVNIRETAVSDVLVKVEALFASKTGFMGRPSSDVVKIAHLIEHLEFSECLQLLSGPSTYFGTLVKQYFDTHCLFEGLYVLWHTRPGIKTVPELSIRYVKDGKEAAFVSLEMQTRIEAAIHARARTRADVCGTIAPVNRGEGGRIFKIITEKNPGVACTSIKVGALKQMLPQTEKMGRDVMCYDLEILLRSNDASIRSFLTPIEYIVSFPKKEKK